MSRSPFATRGVAEAFYGPEGGEGVGAFLAKRKPKFHG